MPRGAHSGYELIQSSTEYFVKLGFPESKLVMGLAFYGHSTTDKSDPMSGHPYSYYVQRFRNALKTYTNELGGYYFTGRDMNRDKTFFCIEEGLSGVFAGILPVTLRIRTSVLCGAALAIPLIDL